MRNPLVCLALLSIVFSPAATAAQFTAELDRIVDAAAAGGAFAGVVLVRTGDNDTYFRAVGHAVREFSVEHTRETRFKYHSLTKPLLSTLVHRLQEDGVLRTSDAICRYLDPCPKEWEAVEVRHLLNHSSGIPELENEWYTHGRGDLHSAYLTIVGSNATLDLESDPGASFRYSNGGYTLLSLILELASGETIRDLMMDHIFSVANMADAGVEAGPDPDVTPWYRGHIVIDRLANGYNGSPGEMRTAFSLMYTIPGAGGVYGTADDLANFAHALFTGELLSDAELLSMLEPQREVHERYADGWIVSERDGAAVYSHTGGTNGFLSSLEFYPDSETTVVVLSNHGFADLRAMTDAIARTVLTDRDRSLEPREGEF